MLFPPKPEFYFGATALARMNNKREDLLGRPKKTMSYNETSEAGSLIRIGDEFVNNSRQELEEIRVVWEQQQFVDYDEIFSQCMTSISNSVQNLTHLVVRMNETGKTQSERSNMMSDFQTASRLLSVQIDIVLLKAFTLGSHYGHEKGKMLLLRMYGTTPKATRLYEYEACTDIGVTTMEAGITYFTIPLRVESTDARKVDHEGSVIRLGWHLPKLTDAILDLVKRLSANKCHPPVENVTDQRFYMEFELESDAVDGFYQNEDNMVRREVHENHILGDVEARVATALKLAHYIGAKCGYESGQTWLKCEYRFSKGDTNVYSFYKIPEGHGIKVKREPKRCSCGDCNECLL